MDLPMDECTKLYEKHMGERDAAIRERNMALVEKKKALVDRDVAIMQHDAVVAERDSVLLELDNVYAQLQYHCNSISGNGLSHREKNIQFLSHLAEAAYNPREVPYNDNFSNVEAASETTKSNKPKTKEAKTVSVNIPPKPARKSQKTPKRNSSINWNKVKPDLGVGSSWKDDLGLNQASCHDTIAPVPVCSCTGNLRPCYKWGKGGWQSACCTNAISMYPLPQKGNKRHSRIGGRKMSGNVYTKLLSRLAAEGRDLTSPVDLKEHWARHGTNRYITLK